MAAKQKAKLHEVICVEGPKEAIYKRAIEGLIISFTKKLDLFTGFVRKLTMFADNKQNENLTEVKEISTSVSESFKEIIDPVVQYIDVVLQKEKTNQKAVADLIVDGKVFAEDLPATFLLGLESKLKFIRTGIQAAPTLPPGFDWKKDEQAGRDIYKAMDNEKFKTARELIYTLFVPATDKHPAQGKDHEENVNVGKYETTLQNGSLTKAKKDEILARIDNLYNEVVQARQRANCTEVVSAQIGTELLKYILE